MMTGLRPLTKTSMFSLGLNLTTPPSGPFGTPSQLLFNPAGTALVAIVKGVPGTMQGGIAVFQVGGPAQHD
jgi:hypothetical protein